MPRKADLFTDSNELCSRLQDTQTLANRHIFAKYHLQSGKQTCELGKAACAATSAPGQEGAGGLGSSPHSAVQQKPSQKPRFPPTRNRRHPSHAPAGGLSPRGNTPEPTLTAHVKSTSLGKSTLPYRSSCIITYRLF